MDGFSNDFIYCGPKGMNVIDYLLCEANSLSISKFVVSNLNVFSDHAPLHFQLRTSGVNVRVNHSDLANLTSRDLYRWVSDMSAQFKEAIRVNRDRLAETIVSNEVTQDSIDNSVQRVSCELQSIMTPFFKVNRTSRSNNGSSRSQTNKSYSTNKPWFNNTLKSSHRDYLHALNVFNKNKKYVQS